MSKLSAIIIVKNGEELIADCLDSLSFCDEIIVVDDNSTDKTADIARLMKAKVFETGNNNALQSFAEKRNFGLKKAKNKWVIYVDVDERVSPELQKNIEEVVEKKESNYAAYRIQRKNFYFGNHEWPFIEKLERVFEKDKLKEWYGELHETAKVEGQIGDIDGFLLHYTHRDLTSMVEKTITWSQTETQLRINANHPQMTWWRFPRVMTTAFLNSYIKQKGYKAGTAGLVESIYQSFSIFITYARLWEMQNQKKSDTNPKI
jgi:glycosyltransferase involved in cell wall biosynthesis